ncbi:hypothetical protein PMAC_002835 [Pneumocystis sp. 'macacae']|nr:hypothetical protein PMAC_002835 [Pneumocystis sp. 'macacae']
MGSCWSLFRGSLRKQSSFHERTALLHSEHVSSNCSCCSQQALSAVDSFQDEQEVLSKIVLRTSERLIDMYTLISKKPSFPDLSVRQSDDLKRLEQLAAPEIQTFNGMIAVSMTRKEWELIESVSKLVNQAIVQAKDIKDVGHVLVKLDKFEETF